MDANSLELQKIQGKVNTLVVEWEAFKRTFDHKPRPQPAALAPPLATQRSLKQLTKPTWRVGTRTLQSLSGTPRSDSSEVSGLLKKCLSLKAQLSASLHGAENETASACFYMLRQDYRE